jgi:MoaA/NifB/PqqE/SkfB family radical SAM enzyme
VAVPTTDHVPLFDEQLADLFRNAWRLSRSRPALALFFLRAVRDQRRAARRRRHWLDRGVQVPPVMIVSITNRCNLNCAGCYSRALRDAGETEFPADRFRALLDEARELGIGIVFLAGGEPLLRPDILDITRDFPDIVFPVFTNGLLIDAGWVKRFQDQRNLVAVASIEGREAETDARRGAGVFAGLRNLAGRVRDAGLFWGCSVTVTRANFESVTERGFVRRLIEAGCRAFFYVEYVPARAGTEALTLAPGQKQDLIARLDEFRSAEAALFIGFPGDEEQFGGCLAAGRGFIHVANSGAIEACPFAPFSDSGLGEMSLRAALNSDLLRRIRAGHDKLSETRGGCALWENRDWVRSLLSSDPPPGGAGHGRA